MATKIIVHTWNGDGVLTVNGVHYDVGYSIRSEGNGNVRKITGQLEGVPAALCVTPPPQPNIPLRLSTGETVEVAVFGGFPKCAIAVNTPMPGLD
jgi:hypothetical protein